MRSSRFLVPALLLTLASAARADDLPALTPADLGEKQTHIDYYHILFRADSLAALIAKAKPTLVYNTTEFLWTHKDEKSARTFSIASARRYKHDGKTEWVIIKSTESIDGVDDAFNHARVDLAVGEKDSTLGHACNLISMHPEFGTLYRLSINRVDPSFAGEPSSHMQEKRILVMHDPEHGWRFVASITGNFAMKRTSTGLNMKIAWTGKPDQPLSLACDDVTTIIAPGKDEREITSHDVYTLAGRLPLTENVPHDRYVVIAKGNTLSALASGFARFENWANPGGTTIAADVAEKILAANPGLKPDRLIIGTKLKIPANW